MNHEFSFNFGSQSNYTPNHNKTSSRNGDDSGFKFSDAPFPNSKFKDFNGFVELDEIKDIKVLQTKFDNQENLLKKYCAYYISLKNVFDSSDISIKNKLLVYVTEFNDSYRKFINDKTNKYIEIKKNSEIKNKLGEDLDKIKEEYNNYRTKTMEEIKELKENKQKEIDDYKNKLNRANDQIKRLNNEKGDFKKIIAQKDKEIYKLREDYKDKEPESPDYLTISYALGEQTKELDISNDCPSKKAFDLFSEKFDKMQNNFNTSIKMLVETCNKTLEKYKEIYFKIKGKSLDLNNPLIKFHYFQVYNIDQNFSWINISNIHTTLNTIIKEIVELVNPTQRCDDPKKLNEDSCEFLLNFIIGLKKLFFTQKQILEKSFNKGDNSEEKKENLNEFQNIMKDAEEFIERNEKILNNHYLYERFQNELKEENTSIMSVDEYLQKMKTVFIQAKNIAEKKENEYNLFIKNLDKKSENYRSNFEDIEMKISSDIENKSIDNNNNGI
jgi:hypothetical protein